MVVTCALANATSPVTATVSDPDPCVGKTMPQCIVEAIEELATAQAELKQVQADLAAAVSTESSSLKLFNAAACPPGWEESPLTKGYVLVGRPDGATTGTQLNRAFAVGEQGRFGPHAHTVKDAGHTHLAAASAVPHVHQIVAGSNMCTLPICTPRPFFVDTASYSSWASPTGPGPATVTVANAPSLSNVQVDAGSGEHYPLAYMLVCQKVNPSAARAPAEPLELSV